MKKRTIGSLVCIFAILLSACAAPAVQQTIEVTPTPDAAQPQEQPASADAIDAASADELRALITQYQAEGDFEMVYQAAQRLLSLDPTDTGAYIAAADALYAMAGAKIDEINSLMAQGAENAQDVPTLTAWAEEHQSGWPIDIPFSHDYSSEDEINFAGISAGNLTNAFKQNDGWYCGFLTWQGDWVYLTRMDEDLAIYKMRADGSEYERLGESRGTCLNIVGDWLYFQNAADEGKIYRVRTDGSAEQKLSDESGSFLSVSGEWMYFIGNDGCLHKTKIDGSESKKLTDFIVINPCVSGDWVYYFEKKPEDAGFCRVSLSGGAPQVIAPASFGNFCIDDEWIYYFDQNSVWRMHKDGSGNEEFYQSDEPITTFNIADGKLYLSAGTKYELDGYIIGNVILSVDMESKEVVQKFDFSTEPICTGPDGWIYFMDDNEGLAWYSMSPEGNVQKIVP